MLKFIILFEKFSGKVLSLISNQNGIKNKSTTREEVQRKVDAIISAIGVPMDFICALDDDAFKKPRTGNFFLRISSLSLLLKTLHFMYFTYLYYHIIFSFVFHIFIL